MTNYIKEMDEKHVWMIVAVVLLIGVCVMFIYTLNLEKEYNLLIIDNKNCMDECMFSKPNVEIVDNYETLRNIEYTRKES